MLSILLGTKEKTDTKLKALARDTGIVKYDQFTVDLDIVRSTLQSSSLFGEDTDEMIVFAYLAENEELFEDIKVLTPIFTQSTKKVALIEESLLKPEVDFFRKAGGEIIDVREKRIARETAAQKKSNPFALADALGKKSPKDAWVEFVRSRRNEIEPEILYGSVVAKVRDMLSVEQASAEELGIHPYVYRKAKMDLKNWNRKELQNFYDTLITRYHHSRMGADSLDIALEKALLSL